MLYLISGSEADKGAAQHAVIKESLRLGLGVPDRLPRVVPEEEVIFCERKIPANVSALQYLTKLLIIYD